MNLKQLLESLEEMLFDYLMYIFLTPKTIFKIFRRPKWIPGYVTEELNKERQDRFQHFVPPAVFWIFLGIIPYYITLLLMLSIGDRYETSFSKAFREISIYTMLAIFIFFLIAMPLACAFTIQIFKRGGITKPAIKRSLYIQFYCFAPCQLLFIPVFLIPTGDNDQLSGVQTLFAFATFASLIWLAVSEIKIARQELNISILKGMLLLPLMYGFCCLFETLGLGIIFVSNHQEISKFLDSWMK